MLGALDDVTLPEKIGAAFVFIGNAIAVPHAILALLVSLQAITTQRIDILQHIRHCWLQKHTAHNTVILHVGEWIHIIHHDNCYRYIGLHRTPPANGAHHVGIQFADMHLHPQGLFAPDATVRSVLNQLLTAPSPILPSIQAPKFLGRAHHHYSRGHSTLPHMGFDDWGHIPWTSPHPGRHL